MPAVAPQAWLNVDAFLLFASHGEVEVAREMSGNIGGTL